AGVVDELGLELRAVTRRAVVAAGARGQRGHADDSTDSEHHREQGELLHATDSFRVVVDVRTGPMFQRPGSNAQAIARPAAACSSAASGGGTPHAPPAPAAAPSAARRPVLPPIATTGTLPAAATARRSPSGPCTGSGFSFVPVS